MKKTIKTTTTIFSLAFLFMAFSFPQNKKATFSTPEPTSTTPPTTFDTNLCYKENKAFQAGEILNYKVYYNWGYLWIPAGEVLFEVKDLGNQYHLSAKGKTYPSYEWFFKVRDRYDTYIDKTTLLPSVAIRDIKEGGYRLYNKVTFDQENNKVISLRGDNKDKTILREFDVEDCMHDIMSILYYTRNIDFENMQSGDVLPVRIYMDKKTWPLQVKYKGKQNKTKVKGTGHFKTLQFSPEVITGEVFEEGTELNIWVTDDNNKIPVLIESPVSVGAVKVVLQGYDNLRYPITAKVK